MRNTITRIASFMLAFGLFIGCSTLFPSHNQNSGNDNLSRQELESELEKVDELIAESENQDNPELFYRKGSLLIELAQRIDRPENRSPVYEDMRESLRRAEQLFEQADAPSGEQKVDKLLKVRWSHEHNRGVQIIQSDSLTLNSSDYERAAAYFNNATIILPDSTVSYKLKAQAYYNNHQLDNAISTLEKVRQNIDPLPSELLEQLAFLYLETGQAEKAVAVYEEAESFSEENLNVIHGLANAYISINNHQKAVELLNLLVETEPENIIYAQTRGTELYFLGVQKVDEMLASTNPREDMDPNQIHEVDSLFSEAEQQLTKALDSNPDNTELEQRLAYFYKNSAANYQRLIPYVTGDMAGDVRSKIESNLKSSIPHFESLTEKNPEILSLWRNLHQIYTYLEMEEKAKEIESKINQQN